MVRVAVFGAGQIGRATYKMLTDSEFDEAFVVDSNKDCISNLVYGTHVLLDVEKSSPADLTNMLKTQKATHVINAMPFFLNEKIAAAAADARCAYIDFTEDDTMADKVQKIYEGTGLDCAVKCGLAPGFINYIGYDLVSQLDYTDTLMISVGALPRAVSYDVAHPECSYNLSWSVDGLVNEYIRPCRVRKDGKEQEVAALSNLTKVILDGTEYEAAFTSGGVGSLVKDLVNVPNVHYMTLRYPGHYKYVRSVVQETLGNFKKIKATFEKKFPHTNDDVIVVYANALGKDSNGHIARRFYMNKFYGADGYTAIQSTTAGSGMAMLELMHHKKVSGIVNHSQVSLADFTNTDSFAKYYKTSK